MFLSLPSNHKSIPNGIKSQLKKIQIQNEYVIKEQKMTEIPFEILPFHRPQYPPQNENPTSYQSLLDSYCSSSYGLYTEYFIKKLVADVEREWPHLGALGLGLGLKMGIRRCVKKFMMTDLELVFLGYYCGKGGWDLDLGALCKQAKIDNTCQYFSHNPTPTGPTTQKQKHLQLYLTLHAYFIKSYIGNVPEFHSIETYFNLTFPQFQHLYQIWILSKPREIFTITPRQINEMYREYSRCQEMESSKKSYNELVDTLIELSTTYSIIPNKKVERRETSKGQGQSKREYSQISRQSHQQRQRQKGDIRLRTDDNPIPHRKHKNSSEIFQIMENSNIVEQEQEEINRFDLDFNAYRRPKRKSSLLFQSLQSLSRKSQQMQTRNGIKQQKPEQQRQKQKQKQQEPQRSRQKKPNKISLNFKRKQQKPNQTVLGFLKHPSIVPSQSEQKGHRPDNRNFRDGQSQPQPLNMSFINLRSNRSSRSNSQLPFLWRPAEDNFFQKSKFG